MRRFLLNAPMGIHWYSGDLSVQFHMWGHDQYKGERLQKFWGPLYKKPKPISTPYGGLLMNYDQSKPSRTYPLPWIITLTNLIITILLFSNQKKKRKKTLLLFLVKLDHDKICTHYAVDLALKSKVKVILLKWLLVVSSTPKYQWLKTANGGWF